MLVKQIELAKLAAGGKEFERRKAEKKAAEREDTALEQISPTVEKERRPSGKKRGKKLTDEQLEAHKQIRDELRQNGVRIDPGVANPDPALEPYQI